MATKKPTVSVILDEKTLEKIEDYQFNNRMSSRSKALNDIIKLGIEAMEREQKENKK